MPSHSNSGRAMILTLANGIIENVIQEEAEKGALSFLSWILCLAARGWETTEGRAELS